MAGVAPAPYRFQFFDNSGNPLNGGKVDVYLAGTTTRTNTWSDRAQTTLNANPIVLDSAGRASIVLDTSKTYKFVVKTSANVTLYTDDNIVGAAGLSTMSGALADIESARVAAIADVEAAQATAEGAIDTLVADAEAASAAAAASEAAALASSATSGVYPNSAASNVPRGLTQASVGAITAGAGGTNGTFALAWSAGNFSINPTGTFTVSGGALTAVTITGPGLYIGASPTVPTPSFAASAGLAGAAVALTAQFLVTAGQGYWVVSSDGRTLDRYKNVAGVATVDTTAVPSLATSPALYAKGQNTLANEAYSEKFEYLDTAAQTVTNITDAAAITNTRTKTSTGLQIVVTTAARDVIFSTSTPTGGSKQRIRYHAAIDSVVSECRVGIVLTDGVSRGQFTYTNGGFLVGNGTTLSSAMPTFTTGDYIDMTLVIDASAGSVYGSVSKNGGAPYVFGFASGVPMGSVYLLQRGSSTVTHSMTVDAVGSMQNMHTRNAIASTYSQDDRDNLAAFGSWALAYLRSQPSSFTGTFPIAVDIYKRETGRTFFGSLNLRPQLSEYDPEVTTIYVDVTAGSDTAAGTLAAPLKSLTAACARILAGAKARMLVKGGLYDYANSFPGGIAAYKTLDIIAYGTTPAISSMHDAGLSWSLAAGTSYTAAYSDTVVNVWDAKTANLTSDGDYLRYTLAASSAACDSTPGSYFLSGGTIRINCIDGRAPDTDIRVMKSSVFRTNNFVTSGDGGSLYLENIAFEGASQSCLRTSMANSTASLAIYAKGCTFKYSGASAYETNGKCYSYLQECVAAWAAVDGFHYNPIFGSTGHSAVEWDCIARWNGVNGGGVANGSSNHGGVTIRVKTKSGYGDYHHSEARGIHDIFENAACLTWNVGITCRDSRNGFANYALGLSSGANKMWLDYCDSSGASADIESTMGSTVYTNQFSGAASNTGAGTITTYTP